MTEDGVLEAAKEGAKSGLFVGFTVGSIRAFLYGEPQPPATTTAPATVTPKQPSPATSLAATALRAARPTPLAMLVSTTAMYSGLGAVYLATDSFAHGVRDKDDMWNSVIAGVVSGSLVGLRTGSLYISAGAASSLAAVSALYHIFDGQFGPREDNPGIRRRRAVYQD
ncbi:Tim17/Tim22/Tim23/Pmp24 [Gracilaria domingensis]|nr:Tim17/Tim22/Tim23/Pmp24 [Gracilaria domingensis]